MIKAAKPIMKKKLRRRGNFLARLLTSTPSPQLAEIYVREEIVKKMQEKEIKMRDGDSIFMNLQAEKPKEPEEKPCPKGSLCFSWPKIGVWKSKMAMCEIPEGGEVATQTKFGKRLLQGMVAVASAFLGVTLLPFK